MIQKDGSGVGDNYKLRQVITVRKSIDPSQPKTKTVLTFRLLTYLDGFPGFR